MKRYLHLWPRAAALTAVIAPQGQRGLSDLGRPALARLARAEAHSRQTEPGNSAWQCGQVGLGIDDVLSRSKKSPTFSRDDVDLGIAEGSLHRNHWNQITGLSAFCLSVVESAVGTCYPRCWIAYIFALEFVRLLRCHVLSILT